MLLDYLKVYKSDKEKTRIGPETDGGYVIIDGLDYDCLVSCGVGNDIEFEKVFHLKYPTIPYLAYDGTINKFPEGNTSITFINKNISYFNSNTTTTMSDIFEKYDNIFLKMDIESFEFRWLQILSLEQLNKIKQLIIEFHYPFTNPGFGHFDMPLFIDQKLDTLKKISETHTLIHLHGNNCCDTDIYNGIVVPNIFECTYVRKDIQNGGKLNSDIIPSVLDRPNISKPDIILTDYPFVTRH